MSLQARAIDVARTWLGTPFHHAARVLGPAGGIDCIGIVDVAYAGAGAVIPGARVGHYRPRTMGQDLVDALGGAFDRVQGSARAKGRESIDLSTLRAGDILCFAMGRRARPHHVALVSRGAPEPWIIHAHQSRGLVQEHQLALGEWAARVHSVYRLRET